MKSLGTANSALLPVSRLIAHQSTNSKAVVQFEIRKMEQIHWLLGLRQAELTIESRDAALRYWASTQRAGDRSLRAKQRKLRRLKFFETIGLSLLFPIEDWTEELEDAVAEIELGKDNAAPYVRDALMERKVAQAELERIKAEHPEALNKSFEELQDEFSLTALQQTHASFLASLVS